MQVIRMIVIIFGLMIVVVGLYLFVLGVGAPIEIKSIEVGALKASATGTFVGLLVAGIGLALTFLAMQYLKRREESETIEEVLGTDGRPTTRITRKKVTFATPPD